MSLRLGTHFFLCQVPILTGLLFLQASDYPSLLYVLLQGCHFLLLSLFSPSPDFLGLGGGWE